MAIAFDESYYLSRNPDVLHAVTQGQFSSGYMHYVLFGARELRNPNAIFNALDYVSSNPDVLAAINAGLIPSAWDHYVHFGITEGRLPSRAFSDFDAASYLQANADVAAAVSSGAFANALQHYVMFGLAEGRPITRSDAIQLTNGTDVLTGVSFHAGLVYTPGGNDRVNSLQDEDRLTGIGINPTLTAILGNANDNGATTVSPTLTGIATINVAFTGSDALTATNRLNLEFATGLKAINVTRLSSTGVATLDRIQSAETSSLFIAGIQDPATVRFLYRDDALSGTNDSASLALKGVTMTEVAVRSRDGASGFESLTLTSQGAANTVHSLVTPQLTRLVINGDQDLMLGNMSLGTDQRNVYSGPGISNDGAGRVGLALVDASALTGKLIIDLTGHTAAQPILTDAGKPGYVTVKGGSADDRFVITETVNDSGLSIDGGDGYDGLLVMRSLTDNAATAQKASITNVELLFVMPDSAGTIEVDTNLISDLSGIVLRNEALPAGTVTFDLDAVSAKAASNITVPHAASGNSGITQTVIDLQLADASGDKDLINLIIGDSANTDQRFNFTLTAHALIPAGADAAKHVIENLSLIDADTESNSIAITRANQYTDSLTVKGGHAGQFLNLDWRGNVYGYDMSARDVTVSIADPVVTDKTVSSVVRYDNIADTDLIIAKSVLAADYAGDLILRVGKADQKIDLGSGNDTIVFNTAAHLSVADSISGGKGTDTIILDGIGSHRIGASEWTNLSGIDVIRLTGTHGADFDIRVTDHLAGQSDAGNRITIINNDGLLSTTQNTATIHFTDVRADKALTFIGGNGNGLYTLGVQTVVLDDASAHGSNILDGGDHDVSTQTGNLNVLRIQNSANITSGDLQQVKNFGTVEAVNSTASAQRLILSLNDSVVDSMVDAGTAASALSQETLLIRALPNSVLPAATTALEITAGDLTAKSGLNILTDRVENRITTGGGDDTVVLLGNYASGIYASDRIWGNSIDELANNVAGARMVTDTLHFGGGNNDELIVWGVADLTGVTGSGLDKPIQAHSKLVVRASQLAPGGVFEKGIDFVSDMDHVLVIIDDVSGNNTIDLTKIIVSQGNLFYFVFGGDGHTVSGSLTFPTGNVNGIALIDPLLSPTNLEPYIALYPVGGATSFDTLSGFGMTDGAIAGPANERIFATIEQIMHPWTLINGNAGRNALVMTNGSAAAATDLHLANPISQIQVLELADGFSNNGLTLPDIHSLQVRNSSANSATVIFGNVPQIYFGGIAADTVTLGSVGQNVSSGGGNDIINATVTHMAGSTVAGGAGHDTLNLSGGGTANLAGLVTGIEELTITEGATASNITLADGITKLTTVNTGGVATAIALSMTADQANKLTHMQLGNTGAAQTIQVTTGGTVDFSNDASVSFSNLGTINFSDAGNTVGITLNQFTSIGNGATGQRLIAGSATTDAITLTDANSSIAAQKLFGFETIKLVGTSPDMTFVAGNKLNSDNSVVTIDGTEVTVKLTISASNESAARLNIKGSAQGDSVVGGSKDDTIYGGAGNDSINGSSGDDVIYGEDGDDYLAGSYGSDLLVGGNGNDTLVGGENGLDTLTGGAGNDVFQTANKDTDYSLSSMTIITDYRAGDFINQMYGGSFSLGSGGGLTLAGGQSISGGIVRGVNNVTDFLNLLSGWNDATAATLAWTDGRDSYLVISNGISAGGSALWDNLFKLEGVVVTGLNIETASLMALDYYLS